MEGRRLVCYLSKLFYGGVLSYLNYDKELYTCVPVVKKWKHYLSRKEITIHIDHQPLKY